MSTNANMGAAKKAKDDEFYTHLNDIENEVKNYKEQFRDKVVFCNCDDPEQSNFFKYFALNFTHLGLKKLITTHYAPEGQAYKLVVEKDINDDGKINIEDTIKTPLEGDGSFDSQESIDSLKECDIVVSNPPFSLFKQYLNLLVNSNKKFLVLGSQVGHTKIDVFKHFKDKNVWFGHGAHKGLSFTRPDGSEKKVGVSWYTNLKLNKTKPKVVMTKYYYGNEEEYPHFDAANETNGNPINVNKVKDIPQDYFGVMGVPITYLARHNPQQFELVGRMSSGSTPGYDEFVPRVNGKTKFARIGIQRVDQPKK